MPATSKLRRAVFASVLPRGRDGAYAVHRFRLQSPPNRSGGRFADKPRCKPLSGSVPPQPPQAAVVRWSENCTADACFTCQRAAFESGPPSAPHTPDGSNKTSGGFEFKRKIANFSNLCVTRANCGMRWKNWRNRIVLLHRMLRCKTDRPAASLWITAMVANLQNPRSVSDGPLPSRRASARSRRRRVSPAAGAGARPTPRPTWSRRGPVPRCT